MKADDRLKRVSKNQRVPAPPPDRFPDTFVLVPRSYSKAPENEPVITIRVFDNGGTRLMLSRLVANAIGFKASGRKLYCQVYTSASTIKLVLCDASAPDARLIAGDGYVTAREIGEWFRLNPGMAFRCNAEVVQGKEIWATYPKELRERIDEINGVVR